MTVSARHFMRRIKNIHFIGIGGAGMSGIAEVFHNLGYIISGSDISEGPMVRHLRELGIDDDAEHVNPNGGAITLGHPLGMSGARLATTAAYELGRRGGRYALCMMCIGVGQGIAMILEAA